MTRARDVVVISGRVGRLCRHLHHGAVMLLCQFFFVDFVLYSSIIQYQICMYMLACNFICLRVPKWMGRRQGLSVLSHTIGSKANPRLPAHHWWGMGWGTLGYGFTWGMRCPTHIRTPTEPVNLPRGFLYP